MGRAMLKACHSEPAAAAKNLPNDMGASGVVSGRVGSSPQDWKILRSTQDDRCERWPGSCVEAPHPGLSPFQQTLESRSRSRDDGWKVWPLARPGAPFLLDQHPAQDLAGGGLQHVFMDQQDEAPPSFICKASSRSV